MDPYLDIDRLCKSFGDTSVLEGVSLQVAAGETLVLLGPSGSGKTTLLRLIAGFETPDSGGLRLADTELSRVPPSRRNFGMVFQHYALFPHLTVGENVAFGLESRRWEQEAVEARVAELLPLVGLEGLSGRRIDQISGGQQQRVALARALAPEPRLLLLDEPLSNLDPELRERTRGQLREILQRIGITAVWVTHEQEEAFQVGDRVALLHEGRVAQVGTPEDLYLRPASRFVASFVGKASVVSGVLVEGGGVRVGDADENVVWRGEHEGDPTVGVAVDLVLRPEGLCLVPAEKAGALVGRVVSRRFLGESTYYRVRTDGGLSLTVRGGIGEADEGSRVGVEQSPNGPSGRVLGKVAESEK